MDKILIIYNPISGPRSTTKILQSLVSSLQEKSIKITIKNTLYPGHATKLCKSNHLQQYNTVIICGGDGTFNEAVNGLMLNFSISLPTIGFLPGGTGNAFMHDLQAVNHKIAIEKILNKKTKKIDILQLQFNNRIEYAINIVGWGMATDILILSEKMRFLGSARYSLASIYYIFNKKIYKTQCIIDGKEINNKKYIFILITNTIHTGKGMKASPNALIDDGLLDIILLKSNISKIQLLQLFPKIFTGQHINSSYIEYIQAKEIKLIPEINTALNIDGEAKCLTPIKVSVLPKRLSIYS